MKSLYIVPALLLATGAMANTNELGKFADHVSSIHSFATGRADTFIAREIVTGERFTTDFVMDETPLQTDMDIEAEVVRCLVAWPAGEFEDTSEAQRANYGQFLANGIIQRGYAVGVIEGENVIGNGLNSSDCALTLHHEEGNVLLIQAQEFN